MAGDRIQINALERALSEDINDLQSMQARVLNDFLSSLSSVRSISNSGGSDDTQPQSFTMGLDIRTNTTSMFIGPGVLSQLSATWPAAPGPLESSQRLGIQRGTVTVPLPGTPSVVALLEAQVVDVTTVSSTRDVFDVPTQTFIPTLLVKQNERQIQYQIVTDANVPAFSGNPWVPLYAFETDISGEVTVLPGIIFLDCRNDLKDIMGDSELRFTPDIASSGTVVSSWAMHSENEGAGNSLLGGNYLARNGPWKGWLKSLQGIEPTNDALVTNNGNEIQHIYLCPLISQGITVFPVFQSGFAPASASKGLLTRSLQAPAAVGPDNSGIITYDSGDLFQNFDPIPSHRAMYCTTAFVGQGSMAASGYEPFSQSSGGKNLMRTERDVGVGVPNGLVNIGFRALTVLSAFDNVLFDLNGLVPPTARTVTVDVYIFTTGPILSVVGYAFQMQGTTRDIGPRGQLSLTGASGIVGNRFQYELPIKSDDDTAPYEAFLWQLAILNDNLDPLVACSIDVTGFSF